jgi:hypothetical protein
VLTLGILSLVFGLLGCGCGPLVLAAFGLGLPAAIMGRGDLTQMRNGERDPSGEGMTNAGMICGIIGCIIACIGVLFFCLWLMINVANH